MSDRFDEYRAIAAFCERMFRQASTMEMKTSWLRLAMNWRALIANTAQPDGNMVVPSASGRTEPAE